ncbi:ketopantoate reductase family protein [Paraburkholderia hayleyella]|uniref:ketopantoate reductase family protein n=1 Tax=Paraburkholderia hayleyella TaxID=2152889 RepID=UPI001290CA77|nr:2-dehydropantoate 2-reductase [Paraburkholderia hayleyella]
MKIAILGAGAMGSLFGGLLAEQNQDVTLLDINEAHLSAIRTQGLILETHGRRRSLTNLRVSRPDKTESIPELLMVFTKSFHTRAALSDVSRVMGPDTTVLTLQNGLGNVELLREFVSLEQIVVGMTTWPADMSRPGAVSSHGAGKIRLMSADGIARPGVEAIAALLNAAGLQCSVDPNVWSAIWEKVAFNAALNSLCAVTGCSVDGIAAVPGGLILARAIVGEVLAVAQAKGIDTDRASCMENVTQAIAKHVGHQPSMLQDVLAGRRTEIEGINGAVVRAAREENLQVTHTETLLELVRLVQARVSGFAG